MLIAILCRLVYGASLRLEAKFRIGFLEFMSISLDGKFILMHVIILFTSAVVMQISR
jgi:hypothetical protein